MPSGILTCCTGPFRSESLCLFGFCSPSLRCLISALTQAGGGDLLFRFARSVQSFCGEGGALQVDVTVSGEHSPCSGQAATVSGPGSQELDGRTLPGCGVPFPSAASGSGSQRLGRPLPGRGAPLPSAAPARAAGRVAGSLQIGIGACLPGGRGGFPGAEFAPFPSPLPHSSSGDGPALLRSFSVPLFCEPPAVCSGRLIFPFSPTV